MRFRRFLLLCLITVMAASMWIPATAAAAGDQKGYKIHLVKRGETLSLIAARYGVSVRAIARANKIRNVNRIYVGQRLRIPTSSASSSPKKSKKGQKAGGPAQTYGGGGKWIEVDLSRQRLIAHEGNRIVLNTLVSTGIRRYPTPIGTFRIRTKVRRQTMSGPGYRLPNVQWVQYFVGAYALHGTYWHHNFGRPMSHGCINLTNRDAKFLYQWATRGTRVVIHR
ncbi:MAG: LysM peptidoglycan-binding domain-containing protein [Caldilineae bacterium]|nr:MAG: LysM peptidoglycan-binding domain-containing protein [Caldilineae bacterium]